MPRTFGGITSMFEAFRDAEGVIKTAKTFGNVIHLLILSAEGNKLVIDLIPPPELHLLLGAFNTLYSG